MSEQLFKYATSENVLTLFSFGETHTHTQTRTHTHTLI